MSNNNRNVIQQRKSKRKSKRKTNQQTKQNTFFHKYFQNKYKINNEKNIYQGMEGIKGKAHRRKTFYLGTILFFIVHK